MAATTAQARRATLLVSFSAFVALGMPAGALGAAWPAMRTDFGASVSALGVLIATLTTGYTVAAAFTGRVSGRLGVPGAPLVAAVVAGVGLVVCTVTSVWWLLVVGMVLVGAGAGLLDAGLNDYVAVSYGTRAMNLLHASFGVGATLGPVIVAGALAGGVGWRGAFGVIAATHAAVVAGLVATRTRWSRPGRSITPTDEAPPPPESTRWLLPAVLLLFFSYTGVEVSSGTWGVTLLVEGRGVPEAAGGIWAASFWAAMTGGRILVGALGARVTERLLVQASLAVTLAGLVLLWWNPVPPIGSLGLPITGLGLAAVFPTLISMTPGRVGPERSTTVVGYQIAAAGLGAAAVPFLAGLAVEAWGVDVLAPFLVVTAALVLAANALTNRLVDAGS